VVYAGRKEPVLNVLQVGGAAVPRQIASSAYFPIWRGDSKEILFLDRDRQSVSSVRVDGSGKDLRFGPPEVLFPVAMPSGTNSGSRPLAVNRAGSRIYLLQSTEQPESGVMQVRTGAIR
jgi:hypothetical protein